MIVLKILAAPVMVALSLLAAMVTFLFCVASAVCELGCIVLTLLSLILFIGGQTVGGIAFLVLDDGDGLFIDVDDLPEIMHFFPRIVSRGQLLIVNRHNFLHIQKIGDLVHVKVLALRLFFHTDIIAYFPCFVNYFTIRF